MVDYGPQNTRLISTATPEPPQSEFDLALGLDDSLSKVINWHSGVERELSSLGHFVESIIRKSDHDSKFVAPQLKYSGIDRDRLTDTYTNSNVDVHRWRYADSAPTFEENGLDKLISNLFEPWLSAQAFQVELIPHKLTRDQDELVVTVIANLFGRTQENVGMEATSMWETRWRIVSELADEIELNHIRVIAHEEVTISASRGLAFQDVTKRVLKLDDRFEKQLNFSLDEWARWIPGLDVMGNHGIAVGDPNNDGLEDIYVCQPHGLPNLLLAQNPDGTAQDIANTSAVNLLDDSRAALFVDLDNDADEDLVITTSQELILLSNDGSGTFQLEHRLLAGYDGGSISAADFDNDGDLDLFISKYHAIGSQDDLVAHPSTFRDANDGGRNVLLRNDEGWNFNDITDLVGLNVKNDRYTRCALWVDIDLDGDQDLYVVNEFSADMLFENNNGWFSDMSESEEALKDTTSNRSGSIGDFNADGRFDIFLASHVIPEAKYVGKLEDSPGNILHNEFLDSVNQDSHVLYSTTEPQSLFTRYRIPRPIFSTQTSYGSANIDLNNDGYHDVMMTNGQLTRNQGGEIDTALETQWMQHLSTQVSFSKGEGDTERSRLAAMTRALTDQIREGKSFAERQRNTCLLGLGSIGFANFSQVSGVNFTDDSRAIATVDWDEDGDLDVIWSSRTAPQLRILGNTLETENTYISLQLVGTKSNRDAIGARVEVFTDRRTKPWVNSVCAGSGTLSQSSKRLHFGLPAETKITQLVVHWPSGLTQRFEDVPVGRRYKIIEGGAEPAEQSDTRFEIDIFNEPAPMPNSPLDFNKTVFYPPVGLPSLQFQGNVDAWIQLRNIDRMPMLAIFVDEKRESQDLLATFAREAAEIAAEKLDIVAIKIDGVDLESRQSFAAIKTMATKNEFPFRFGSASKSMLQKIGLFNGQWFSDQHVPKPPFAWLLDRHGKVRVFYPTGKVQPYQALEDIAFISGGMRMTAERASPREGIWIGSLRPPSYTHLAIRFEELGFINDRELFEELSRPHIANQLCQQAIELQAQGNLDDAVVAFESALDLDPECEMACIQFGQLLINQASEEADHVVRGSILNQAQSLFEDAIRIDPANVNAILGRADVARHRNQVGEAIKQLNDYLKINPDRCEVHAIVGRLYFHQQQFVQATTHLLQAWDQRPTLPFVAGDLGFLYLNGGAYEDARKFLRRALRLQPSAVHIKRHLASAEYLTGNYDRSISLLKEVSSLEPNETKPKLLLAWLLSTCPFETSRDGKLGLEIAKTLVKIYDDQATPHEVCAAAYAENGDFKKALFHQERALDLVDNPTTTERYSPAQIEGLNNRIELYKRRRPCRTSDYKSIPVRQPGT